MKHHDNNHLRVTIAAAITLAFVVSVEYWLGWLSIMKPWMQQSTATILAACIFMLFTYWLRSMRLYDYFQDELKGRFRACLKITLTHNFFNNLLPMRTGEVSFPILMHRHFAMNAARSTTALIWFRLMDMHSLGLIALSVIGWYLWGTMAMVLLMAGWILLAPLMYFAGEALHGAVRPDSRLRLARHIAMALEGLPRSWQGFMRAWAWTLTNWLVKLAVFTWVLRLFIDASGTVSWLAVIGGELTSVLPIHGVAGVGTYESGVVAAMMPFGVSIKPALAAAINLHVFLLATAILGGVLGLAISKSAIPPASGKVI